MIPSLTVINMNGRHCPIFARQHRDYGRVGTRTIVWFYMLLAVINYSSFYSSELWSFGVLD